MPQTTRFHRVLKHVVQFFHDHNIEYIVYGAWAVSYWGQPRATEDFDFMVLLSGTDFTNLKNELFKSDFFERDIEWEKHNPLITKYHMRLKHDHVIVDIALPRDEHDKTTLQRRLRKEIGTLTLFFPTPEDIILQKLKAGRGKDFDDALSVFIKQKDNIKADYLRSWAKKLGIYEELNWLFTKS